MTLFAVCRLDKARQIYLKECTSIGECDAFYSGFSERFYGNDNIQHREVNGIHYYNLYIPLSFIWQMTQAEYIESMRGKRIKHSYYNRLGQLMANHKSEVEIATQCGKPVSDSVLKDYPDVQRRYHRLES